MVNNQNLFLIDMDELKLSLYRSGNATSPSFSESRALKDLTIYEKNGERWIRANRNGFSAFNHITTSMKK